MSSENDSNAVPRLACVLPRLLVPLLTLASRSSCTLHPIPRRLGGPSASPSRLVEEVVKNWGKCVRQPLFPLARLPRRPDGRGPFFPAGARPPAPARQQALLFMYCLRACLPGGHRWWCYKCVPELAATPRPRHRPPACVPACLQQACKLPELPAYLPACTCLQALVARNALVSPAPARTTCFVTA